MFASIKSSSLARLRPYAMRGHRLMTCSYDHALTHALVCMAARNGGQATGLKLLEGTLSKAKG